MNKFLSSFISFVLVTSFIVAQESGEKELGNWYEITTSNRISDKISISGSITNWNYEFSTNNRQLVLGLIGVNYHLSKKVRVGLMVGRAEIDTNFGDVDLPNIQERVPPGKLGASDRPCGQHQSRRLGRAVAAGGYAA